MAETATYQRTEDIPLEELTPFPGNAKRGNAELILDSLRYNGQYRSLVVRTIDNGPLIVLAGNHTLQALTAHGPGPCDYGPRCGICGGQPWKPTARCEVVTCDDSTARRINLVDNRSADLGDYDNDALAELLSYLDDDYQGTGYTEDYVQALITPPSEDWEDAFDNLPEGDRQHLTRTFTLTAEQAEIVDRAVTSAQDTDDTSGNRNGAALTTICDTYNRSHT